MLSEYGITKLLHCNAVSVLDYTPVITLYLNLLNKNVCGYCNSQSDRKYNLFAG